MGNTNNSSGIEQNNDKCQRVYENLKETSLFKYLDELRNDLEGQIILPNETLKYNLARTRPYNIDQQGLFLYEL